MQQQDISLDIDDAIDKAQKKLNTAMIEYDRWINQNPTLTTPQNVVFRNWKQTIKLLRLQIAELNEMKNESRNVLRSIRDYVNTDDIKESQYTKPRTIAVIENRSANKLGTKGANKLSR